jgi:4-diphosphocytidyl-2-C-methyl-D-erythritol kinase
MRVRAFAKINLSLRVLGRRADGYHELRTVFQSIALHDTLRIERTRGPFVLACSDPACPAGPSNLIWRAADAVWRAAGRRGQPRGVTVTLDKRIPMQAGLGGGSADAAAALRAFAALWAPSLPTERLRAIAAALGADVPFFLEGGTVLGLDRGDVLYPLADPPASWVAVVVPAFGVSTKDAFAWWDASQRAGGRTRARPPVQSRRAAGGVNDLEREVAGRHPEVGRLVAALRRAGASLAAMSGSGSAVFGLFASREAARSAAAALGNGRQVFVTRTLNRRAYQRLAGSGLPARQPIVYT